MKKLLVICLAMIIIVLSGCESAVPADNAVTPEHSSQTPTLESNSDPEPETPNSVPKEEPIETYVIDFAGLQLRYPKKWENAVTIALSENKASFSCGDVKLFDILANSDEGLIIGTVCADEYTVLSVKDFDIENADNDELSDMQEDVNVILQNLMKDYKFIVGAAVEKEDDSTYDIKTSIVTLKYPAKWQEIVTVNVSDDKVSFLDGNSPVFDLVFSECDGNFLGTYADTPIYLVCYTVELDEQIAMQEDVNVILKYLMEDPNFIVNI